VNIPGVRASSERALAAQTAVRTADPRPTRGPRLRLWRLLVLALPLAAAYLQRDFVLEGLAGAVRVGWRFLWLLPVFLAWSLAAVLGWRVLLSATPRSSTPSLARLLNVRTQALAVSFAVPLAGVAGDAVRAGSTQSPEGLRSSAPAVVLDRIASWIAEIGFAFIGLAAYAAMAAADARGIAIAGTFLVALALAALGWRRVLRAVGRLPWLRHNPEVHGSLEVLDTNAAYEAALPRSLGWHALERLLIVAEIWLIAALLGLPLGPLQALIAGALTTFFAIAFAFLPGQLGAYEGALSLAFDLLHLPASAGLSVALVRRARQLLTVAAGFVLLLRGGALRRRQASPPPAA
jgi:hypothetical protein